MRVIIVGASKIAYALMKQISEEGVDIVVIDKLQSAIDKVTDAFDCNGYVGNGSSPTFLKQAGIDSAALFVALTKSDETNILCCQVAKKLGVKKTVASVRNPEYREDKQFILDSMGVDALINPDMQAAREVNKIMRYAKEIEIEHFGDSDVAVATVTICDDSVLVNAKMPEIQEKIGVPILVCAIERKGKMITPKGKHDIKAGDKLTFAAIGDDMDQALSKLNIMKNVVKNVVIIGAGKSGKYLAQILLADKVKVTLIDNDPDKCKELTESLPKANVICGDGTDTELIERELKGKAACAIMTGSDEENLIISMFAKSMGMDRIAAEVDNSDYRSMLKKSGINHIFSTRDVSIGKVIRDMRALVADEDDNDNNVIKWFYTLNEGKVEAVEFELTPEFPLLGIDFKDEKFNLKSGILIAVIIRDGVAMVPNGSSSLQVGDRVVVVSSEHHITKLTQIIA